MWWVHAKPRWLRQQGRALIRRRRPVNATLYRRVGELPCGHEEDPAPRPTIERLALSGLGPGPLRAGLRAHYMQRQFLRAATVSLPIVAIACVLSCTQAVKTRPSKTNSSCTSRDTLEARPEKSFALVSCPALGPLPGTLHEYSASGSSRVVMCSSSRSESPPTCWIGSPKSAA